MKKSVIYALMIMFLVSLTGTAAAAPMPTDVPAKHWAYDAVSYLAKAGIIEGYDDKTFRGDKPMTRYEMSKVVAKAMDNSAKATAAQKALIDKLAIEFALELNNLASRVTKLEQSQPNIKWSGTLLEQYKIKTMENASKTGWASNQWQVRINATAKVDEDTTIGLRLANPAPTATNFKDSTANYGGHYGSTGSPDQDNSFKADRFFATTKTGVTLITVGRQAMAIDPEDVIVDSGFFSYDGLKIAWKWGDYGFDFKRGRFARNVVGYAFGAGITTNAADFNNVYIDSARVAHKSGKLDYGFAWARFSNNGATSTDNHALMNYTFANLGYGFNDRFSMQFEVGKNSRAATDGGFWMARAVYGDQVLNAKGKQNFTVQYLHAGKTSINGVYTSFDQPSEDGNNGVNGHSWNNLDLAYRYAFSKNMIGKVEYGSVRDQVNALWDYHLMKFQLIYKY